MAKASIELAVDGVTGGRVRLVGKGAGLWRGRHARAEAAATAEAAPPAELRQQKLLRSICSSKQKFTGNFRCILFGARNLTADSIEARWRKGGEEEKGERLLNRQYTSCFACLAVLLSRFFLSFSLSLSVPFAACLLHCSYRCGLSALCCFLSLALFCLRPLLRLPSTFPQV